MYKSLLKYYFSFTTKLNRFLWNETAVQKRRGWVKYTFCIILLTLATLIKLFFYRAIGPQAPFVLYFGVVILCIGFGGIGPGVFATICSVLLTRYFFMQPTGELILYPSQPLQIGTFVAECLFLTAFGGAILRTGRIISKSSERFKALIENSRDAIAVIDANGKILFSSSASEKITGYNHDELKTINILSNFKESEKPLLKRYFDEVLNSDGRSLTFLHNFLHKNGQWIWIESTLTNLLNNPGVSGIVCNFSNVTERILLEKQKDDFIAIATHELKTPVTSIKAYTQILLKRFNKEGNDQASIMVTKMDGQLNKLIGLIADLLDVTKIEGGRLQLYEEFYEFNDLVKEIVEELGRTTDNHAIILNADKTIKVYGDRERIGQVLTNLISNAIKYSPLSTDIKVTATTLNNSVTVCVEDSGVGISEENSKKIFERFYRVSGPENQSFPGLGLGLYISKEIIKRQGGKIWVESSQGKGSTFCFYLPADYRANANNLKNTKSNIKYAR